MKTDLKPLPINLRAYVDHMVDADKPMEWAEIVLVTPGRNLFWLMKRRGLVKNVTRLYELGEPYTGPRFAKYVLSELGLKYAR